MSRIIDETGNRYGILTVIKRVGSDRFGQLRWECVCDCGNTTIVSGGNLRRGLVNSCGCRGQNTEKHSKTNTRLYRIWAGMKGRCKNSNLPAYKDYGGRGITVCDEWDNSFVTFEKWALKNGYDESLTIDRVDNDGGYCPANCRWATRIEQSRNRRSRKTIAYNGESLSVVEWAEIVGINPHTIYERLRQGWTVKDALETDTKRRHRIHKNGWKSEAETTDKQVQLLHIGS